MKIDFRSQVNISLDFANWLDKLVEPNLDKRFNSAEDALLGLWQKSR